MKQHEQGSVTVLGDALDRDLLFIQQLAGALQMGESCITLDKVCAVFAEIEERAERCKVNADHLFSMATVAKQERRIS